MSTTATSARPLPLTALLLTIAILAGCVRPQPVTRPPEPPPPPLPPPKYYVMSMQAESGAKAGELGNQVDQLAKDAPRQLRTGVKIGLFPPDRCVTTTAAPKGAVEASKIGMDCGVLMSGLERRLAKAGYEVVSWQSIKPGGAAKVGRSAIDRARELKIDVLFEIDQLSIGNRDAGSYRVTGMSFGAQTTASDRQPIKVQPLTAHRCKQLTDKVIASILQKEFSATMAAKAVHVRSGRALWYYKKSVVDNLGHAGTSRDVYFAAAPERHRTSPLPEPIDQPRGLNGMQRGGAAALIVGLVAVGVGVIGHALAAGIDGEDHSDETAREAYDRYTLTSSARDLGTGMLVSGGLITAGGAVLLYLGNREARKPTPLPAPPPPQYSPVTYAEPDQILCAVPPTTPPWAMPTAAAGPAPQQAGASTYTFKEQTSAATDNRRARDERLYRLSAEDFVAELKKLASRTLSDLAPEPAPAPAE